MLSSPIQLHNIWVLLRPLEGHQTPAQLIDVLPLAAGWFVVSLQLLGPRGSHHSYKVKLVDQGLQQLRSLSGFVRCNVCARQTREKEGHPESEYFATESSRKPTGTTCPAKTVLF